MDNFIITNKKRKIEACWLTPEEQDTRKKKKKKEYHEEKSQSDKKKKEKTDLEKIKEKLRF